MNPIETYVSKPLNDGRKTELFKAICEANRKGWSRDKVEKELLHKAVSVDGMSCDIAKAKLEDVYKRYSHEHGVASGKVTGRIVDTLDDPESIIEWDWKPIHMPVVTLDPREQAKEYIQAVFTSGDVIAIDNNPIMDSETKKITPSTPKCLIRYDNAMERWDECGDILFKHDAAEDGAFIMVNPVNVFKGGKSERDVMDYRHVLIECDHLPLELQIAAFKALNLPLSAVVYSGGRSIHGVMRIDAGRNWELYKKRVDFVFSVITRALVPVDTNCKNPNRWNRLPGLKRKDKSDRSAETKIQSLLGTHWGPDNYQEWEQQIIVMENKIPPAFDFSKENEIPPLKRELIMGILREGQKMLIAAPIKKGKSLIQIQLALALSAGVEWLGFKCTKTKSIYCSLEGDDSEAINRVALVGETMGISDRSTYPLVLSLEKFRSDMESLAKIVIAHGKANNAGVIFIDPSYTLIGDEISSSEVKKLTKMITLIGQHTGAAVIFSHHSNKGTASYNQGNHTDQISGSGVFGRFPDAIMTFNRNDDGIGRVLFTLRSFRTPEPIPILFEYPLFRIRQGNSAQVSEADKPSSKGRKPKISDEDFKAYIEVNPEAEVSDIMKHFDISMSLAYEKIRQCEPHDNMPMEIDAELCFK